MLSIITNIGYDHTKFLGNKITSIANEKAGIIKKNIPVLIGEKNQETDKIFIEKAKRESSKIFFTEDLISSDIRVRVLRPIIKKMKGLPLLQFKFYLKIKWSLKFLRKVFQILIKILY